MGRPAARRFRRFDISLLSALLASQFIKYPFGLVEGGFVAMRWAVTPGALPADVRLRACSPDIARIQRQPIQTGRSGCSLCREPLQGSRGSTFSRVLLCYLHREWKSAIVLSYSEGPVHFRLCARIVVFRSRCEAYARG